MHHILIRVTPRDGIPKRSRRTHLASAGGNGPNRGGGRDATGAVVVCRQQDEIMRRQGQMSVVGVVPSVV